MSNLSPYLMQNIAFSLHILTEIQHSQEIYMAFRLQYHERTTYIEL